MKFSCNKEFNTKEEAEQFKRTKKMYKHYEVHQMMNGNYRLLTKFEMNALKEKKYI